MKSKSAWDCAKMQKKKGGISIMKKVMIQRIENIGYKTLANLAMRTAEHTANELCVFIFHQPKMPDEVKALRRF